MRRLLISVKRLVGLAAYSCRSLHLWQSASYKGIENILDPVIEAFPQEVTSVSHGVGFIVGYAPLSSSDIWVASTVPSLLPPRGELGTREDTAFARLRMPHGCAVREVAAGREHIVALSTEGEAFSYGSNCYGQCGRPKTTEDPGGFEMRRIEHLPRLKQIRCGLDHTLFLSTDERLFACGWSGDGQTGVGHYNSVFVPSPVTSPEVARDLYATADTSFALTVCGELFAWGNNEYGQLGVGSPNPQINVPTKVSLSSLDGSVVSVAPGGSFTAFLTSNGSVYYCGYGLGPEVSHAIKPVSLSKLRSLSNGLHQHKINFIQASLHYLMLSSDGILWTLWGRFPGKRLAPAIYGYSSPHQVFVPVGARQVRCGPTGIAAFYDVTSTPAPPISTAPVGSTL